MRLPLAGSRRVLVHQWHHLHVEERRTVERFVTSARARRGEWSRVNIHFRVLLAMRRCDATETRSKKERLGELKLGRLSTATTRLKVDNYSCTMVHRVLHAPSSFRSAGPPYKSSFPALVLPAGLPPKPNAAFNNPNADPTIDQRRSACSCDLDAHLQEDSFCHSSRPVGCRYTSRALADRPGPTECADRSQTKWRRLS